MENTKAANDDKVQLLTRLGGGATLGELYDAISDIAQEVVRTGKMGGVSLTIALSNKAQGDELVIVDAKVTKSLPQANAKGAAFYAVDGGLYRQDPRQIEMDFRDVGDPKPALREVPPPDSIERSV
jgi:hypothetical protein